LGAASYPGLLTAATFASGLGSNNWTLQNQYTYNTAGQVATKALSVSNGTASGLLTTTYGYDNLGALTSIQYPSPSPLTLTYTLDSLERPVGLTDNTNYTWASGVQYNPASQITNALFPSGTETWMYNTLNQLYQRMTTSPSGTPLMNMTYNYTAGANNGQIGSSSDAVTGEKVTYTYDSLKRLVNAASTSLAPGNATIWSDAYTYDPFGNLIGMTPGGNGAPTLSQSITVSSGQPTNQFTGVSYDTNGNVTAYGPPPAATLGYDVANRLATVNTTNAYAYDPANQRVYFNTAGTETLYFYGLGGKKLATYTIAPSGSQVSFTFLSRNIYFAGKLISAEGKAVAVDRLGSVRWNATAGNHTYYPYGAEYSATSNDTEKYATYTRDSLTVLDYAINRHYSSAWGRFMTPDPSYASMDLRTPQSWNRYMYALGDPIAESDPSGLDEADYGDDVYGCPEGESCFFGGGGGGAGVEAGIGGSFDTNALLTDASGNLIVDENGYPILGDISEAGSGTTVAETVDPLAIYSGPFQSSPVIPSGPVIGPPPASTGTGQYSDYFQCALGKMADDVDDAFALSWIAPFAFYNQQVPPPLNLAPEAAAAIAAGFGFVFNTARGRIAAAACSAQTGVYIGHPPPNPRPIPKPNLKPVHY
jgi:RHS repeat-associated protein